MKQILDSTPVATIVFLVVAIVGGVIAIMHPDTLSFKEYSEVIGASGVGTGALGLARSAMNKG